MKAYTKDVIKTIIKGKKRFLALAVIAALGVCMMTGLKAACDDLRYSADAFFDKQNLFDIMVVSTLGLTDDDIESLSRIDAIEQVEGAYSETVYTSIDGKTKKALINVLSENGINMPYLKEGKMPQASNEILVTQKYIFETGKKIGDTIVIEEDMDETDDEEDKNEEKEDSSDGEEDDLEIEVEEEKEEPNFLVTEYTIVGSVIDVTDINSQEGAVSFRANSTTDYTFFVLPEAVTSDIYTAVYITLDGTDELQCYSAGYEASVDEIVTILEDEIKADREQARYDSVTGEAMEKVTDAEEEMNEKFADAEKEIADAKSDIEDAKKEIKDAEKELRDGEKEVKKAEDKLEKAEKDLKKEEKKAKKKIEKKA